MSLQFIKLKLASPDDILDWSHGEVTKPETINYRTQKSEKDGLFCERIFGPEKDWECYCGKYKKIRYKGIVCDKCGVEITRAIVRRERMGHIKLAVPVAHIWFLRGGSTSKIGLMLGLSLPDLERVIYFASYVITKINEEARQKAIEEIDREYKSKLKTINSLKSTETVKLKDARDKMMAELKNLHRLHVVSEIDYFDLSAKYGEVFEAGIGAEAILKLLREIDLNEEIKILELEVEKASELIRTTILKRLRLIKGMIKNNIQPTSMILTVLPVLPPDLRPMVALDGGRYATSDLNDLYRRIINRNNRLKKLLELNAPEVICRNEKRMLQESIDALIDNSARRGQGPVMATTGQRRQLKSLADMLRGKQGRFRQNLLGKRVDYSGRSVIVIGPKLKLQQCGLPKSMALELFKPFIIQKIIERELAFNIKGATRLIDQETDEVWAILEEVTNERYVLLNRAPTLHRLGVQAFKPVLIEGSAIQIHPMVCRAFNADFDGDQMAVHVPLTKEAQKEAEEIMLSSKNLLKPATGDPIVGPTQDIVLGCYFLTKIIDGLKGDGKIFFSIDEAVLAYQFAQIDLRAKIKIRAQAILNERSLIDNPSADTLVETSAGRLIFNRILPDTINFVNQDLNQKAINNLVDHLIEKCDHEKTVMTLDRIKNMGFEYSTLAGISLGIDDFKVPQEKYKILNEAEQKVEEAHNQYLEGLLTKEERKSKIIEIWFGAMNKIRQIVIQAIGPANPIFTITDSNARGSWGQVTQMIGLKGLVANPAGEIIELPIKSSFKEGFNVLEYFISTHGARKGAADTALKTSKAGYLTRRLVDVAQDVIAREDDCGETKGIIIYREDGKEFGKSLGARVFGRACAEDLKLKIEDKEIIIKKGQLIDKALSKYIDEADLEKIRVYSVITCQTKFGICQKCYGYDLGKNQLVQFGAAVGIVTAQAIGEPGTQLTMRTFHTGGVAGGDDITQGLPRIEEIFEVRLPKTKGLISEVNGRVIAIKNDGNQKIIRIQMEAGTKKGTTDIKEYSILSNAGIWVNIDDQITKGQQLTEGHLDLKDLFKIAGQEITQRHILKEVQAVYSSQGAAINDKHIEMITRQMFSRIRIKDAGDTNLLAGSVIEKSRFELENEKIKKAGKKPAVGLLMLLGISRVSLSTESWLSAASFQETTRVLIEAAIQAKEDKLNGLKENVIIGKLIPAGTGFGKIEE